MKKTIAHPAGTAPARTRAAGGRPRLGTVIPHIVGGRLIHYDVRIVFNDGTKSGPIHLDDPLVTDEAEARKIAAEWSAMAARGEIVSTAPPPSPSGELEGWVYFAAAGSAIKIGWTGGAPEKRLKELGTGSARDLHLLGAIPAKRHLERELHRAFAGHRLRGEWYRNVREIRAYAAAHGTYQQGGR